jgi:hypothetical protein
VRAIRWRLASSIVTLAVATLAVLASAIGPVYLRAADGDVIQSTLAGAPISARGVTVIGIAQTATLSGVLQGERRLREGTSQSFFGPPTTQIETGIALTVAHYHLVSELLNRTGECAQLRLTSGSRCPSARGEVLLSVRTAQLVDVRQGGSVPVRIAGLAQPRALRVVGLYDIPTVTAAYWWDEGVGLFAFGQAAGENNPNVKVDPFFTTSATALDAPATANTQVTGDVPLRVGAVHVGRVGAFRRALSAATAALASQGLTAGTQVGALLASAASQERDMVAVVAVVAVQLMLLALWVLSGLVVRGTELRRAEARLSRLRGFTPGGVLAATVAEPAALCLLGWPAGLLGAWLVVWLVSGSVLPAHPPVALDLTALAASLLGVLAVVLVVLVSSRRLLRARLDLQGDVAVRASAGSRWALAGDVALITLGAGALVELGTTGVLSGGSHIDPAAAVAPGALAVAVAAVAARGIGWLARGFERTNRDRGSIAGFLATRYVSRSPAVVRQSRVLVAALALACFSASAWTTAGGHRRQVASFELGTAGSVLGVQPAAGLDPIAAVDRADPTGRWAMAAAVVSTSSSSLLAVDTSRFARIGAWTAAVSKTSLRAIDAALHPKLAPPVTLRGGSIRLRVDAVTGGGDDDLNLWVYDPLYAASNVVDLGQLQPGSHDYVGDISGSCLTICRVVGVAPVPSGGTRTNVQDFISPPAVQLTVSEVATAPAAPGSVGGPKSTGRQGSAGPAPTPAGGWQAAAFDLAAGGWRSGAAGVTVDDRGSELVIRASPDALSSEGSGVSPLTPPLAVPDDTPLFLPAVPTTENAQINETGGILTTVAAQALDGETLDLRPRAEALVLPQLGDNGVLVDLGLLRLRQLAPAITSTTYQVWLAPGAPATLTGRLEAAGLKVVSDQTESSIVQVLDRSGPALAGGFLLFGALTALALAAAGTLASVSAAARERAADLVMLEAAGVPRRTLRRALMAEHVVLVVAALAGTASGALATVLALPSLPEMAGAPFAPPLAFPLPLGTTAEVTAAVVVAIIAGAVIADLLTLRRASPDLLRAGPE